MTVQQSSHITLCLLRSLLRECTYLPDPAARTYAHSHILTRFREYCPREHYRQSRSITDSRRAALLRQARKGLSLLVRANTGEFDALKKILAYTYGRIGKRRHELLNFARAPSNLQNSQDVMTIAAASLEFSEKKDLWDPKMKALVRAHMNRNENILWRSPVKNSAPQIPSTNSWGRPLPLKRKANIEKRWYASVLDKISPPLPIQEWRRLRDLAIGEIDWSGPITRRGNSLQTLAISNVRNPHQLTARYMRRMWSKVFSQCPVMTWDNVKSQWKVRWGSIDGMRPLSVLERESDQAVGLFQGVDERGKPTCDFDGGIL
ncbi:hypothetical protein MMC14_003854 [Varicellaria rhodocarpa]|nr:hypothetical protein [Varicellaria rhodocarpa]